MKKLLGGIALTIACASCTNHPMVINGSGEIANDVFDISLTYSELTVREGIRVELVQSTVGEGTVTADEEVIRFVSIVEKDGGVVVDYRNHLNGIISPEIETVVTLPISDSLTKIKASSAGQVTSMYQLASPRMSIEASSTADVSLKVETSELDLDISNAAKCILSVICSEITANVSGAARCNVNGTTRTLDVDTQSAAKFDSFGLVCEDVKAETSSAATIEITVTQSLQARATSGGSMRYKGSPTYVKEDVSSGGSIRHVD